MNTFFLVMVVLTQSGGRDTYVIDYAFTEEDCIQELADERPFIDPSSELYCSNDPRQWVNERD